MFRHFYISSKFHSLLIKFKQIAKINNNDCTDNTQKAKLLLAAGINTQQGYHN